MDKAFSNVKYFVYDGSQIYLVFQPISKNFPNADW